ncbi:uncharacterized protein VTP21DRAFT_2779 [Calcarisporiella thermophila]|uniref:uncharacterized protein n=1 Tax=Calcarisporiella thermophila TaxID=911321 RepID=UPI0037443313
MSTHYELLQVPETATAAQIKQQFQKLILKHHPDKQTDIHSQSSDWSQRILEAYDILRRPETRTAYDAELKAKKSKELGIINGEIDLDEMMYDETEDLYTYTCRCGGLYTITEEDMEIGAEIVQCSSCSLRMRILYEIAPLEEDKPEEVEDAAS